MKKQITKDSYFNLKYNDLYRFVSYWHQLNVVVSSNPKKVLEIGSGNKILTDLLKKMNITVQTLDIDEKLKPDFVGEANKIPCCDNSFDLVCAFEVLEHIPYSDVFPAISEMKRVSSNKIIFSIPDRKKFISFQLRISGIRDLNILLSAPSFMRSEHKFDGQHYWELNKQNYGINNFKAKIEELKLTLIDDFRIKRHPYHHFFILKK